MTSTRRYFTVNPDNIDNYNTIINKIQKSECEFKELFTFYSLSHIKYKRQLHIMMSNMLCTVSKNYVTPEYFPIELERFKTHLDKFQRIICGLPNYSLKNLHEESYTDIRSHYISLHGKLAEFSHIKTPIELFEYAKNIILNEIQEEIYDQYKDSMYKIIKNLQFSELIIPNEGDTYYLTSFDNIIQRNNIN